MSGYPTARAWTIAESAGETGWIALSDPSNRINPTLIQHAGNLAADAAAYRVKGSDSGGADTGWLIGRAASDGSWEAIEIPITTPGSAASATEVGDHVIVLASCRYIKLVPVTAAGAATTAPAGGSSGAVRGGKILG